MADKKSNIALLVHSCDRYEFLYQGFEFFFAKHWPMKIACHYYFATEKITATIKGFQNIKSGNGQWSDRLRNLLEQLDEEYIIYFQEDMWLDKQVDAHFFEQLFKLATEQKWQQVKLHSTEVYVTKPTQFSIDGFTVAKLDNVGSDYLMSHQVTFWNKQFLIQQLAKDEHPWRNERRGTKRLRKQNPDIYHIDYFGENGKPAINENKPAVIRSEYYTVSVNSVLNEAVLPYIEVLKKGQIEDVKYANELEHHYRNQLTHDGKPRPRKEDLLQKIKRKWKERRPRESL